MAAQEQVVGRLLQKRVAELVAGAWPADGSQHALADELGESTFESCPIQRFECLEQLPRELASKHGGHVEGPGDGLGGTGHALRGSERVVAHLSRRLGIEVGQTTPDGRFTLETVECLASCGTAPAMQVNRTYHEQLDEAKLDRILETLP